MWVKWAKDSRWFSVEVKLEVQCATDQWRHCLINIPKINKKKHLISVTLYKVFFRCYLISAHDSEVRLFLNLPILQIKGLGFIETVDFPKVVKSVFKASLIYVTAEGVFFLLL